MTPPTANTRVLEIKAAGSTPDWDSPEVDGAPKFQGSISAVYTERKERAKGATGDNSNVRRSLTFFPRSLGDLKLEVRDTIVYIWRNEKRSGAVVRVEEFDMPGRSMPGSVRVAIDPDD